MVHGIVSGIPALLSLAELLPQTHCMAATEDIGVARQSFICICRSTPSGLISAFTCTHTQYRHDGCRSRPLHPHLSCFKSASTCTRTQYGHDGCRSRLMYTSSFKSASTCTHTRYGHDGCMHV